MSYGYEWQDRWVIRSFHWGMINDIEHIYIWTNLDKNYVTYEDRFEHQSIMQDTQETS